MRRDQIDWRIDLVASRSVPKKETRATHRSRPIAITLSGLERCAGLAGITRLCDVTGLDRIGLPVVMAVRPLSRSLSVWQGKSATIDGAKVSGLMEAIETFCAEAPPRSLIAAARRDLEPEDVRWLNKDLRSQQQNQLLNRIGWLRGYDLIAGREVLVPRGMVGHAMSVRSRAGHLDLFGTNGLASGNDLVEAVLHGLCELIERDAETIWNVAVRSQRRPVSIDLATIDDPLCVEAVSRFVAADVSVTVYDAMSDIGVPCFIAVIDDAEQAAPKFGQFLGAGCHPVPAVALFRALSEAAQSRLTAIVGAREDLVSANYHLAGLLNPIFTFTETPRISRRFDACSGFASTDVGEDLRWVIGQMKKAGVRHAVAVDLTNETIGVPVVRVMAPELENYRHRSADMQGRRAVSATSGAK